MATAEMHEKQPHHVDHVDKDHVERIEVQAGDEKEIHRIPTLGVDLSNAEADKGDESDGKIDWTLKQILATIFLCGLYVGNYLSQPIQPIV
jgi:hypothetical protein